MRLTGISTGNAMEATLGSLWGEDPRYFRAAGQPLKGRVKNVIVMTFAARRADGNLAPGLCPIHRQLRQQLPLQHLAADSESGVGDACVRTAAGLRRDGWAATPSPSSGPTRANTYFTGSDSRRKYFFAIFAVKSFTAKDTKKSAKVAKKGQCTHTFRKRFRRRRRIRLPRSRPATAAKT